MGNLTHTVSGDIASFRSAARVPIESLKCHFLPIQEGTGDPSPDNVRPITGWTRCEIKKAKKNLIHILGFSIWSTRYPGYPRNVTGNNYGTSLSTSDFNLPDTPLVVTQEPQEVDYTASGIYRNGYFVVECDNLQFEHTYRLSFKISNIVSNPLNKTLSDIRIANPNGARIAPSLIDGDRLVFNAYQHKRSSSTPDQQCIYIYTVGMSFTLSEFMITEQGVDYNWEPYCGEIIPITFPVLGKNKFNYNNANIINNKRLDDTGNEVSDASGSYCKTLISVIPNTTYTLSGYTENNTSKRIYYIDKNQNFISRGTAFGGNSYTFITPDNCYYCQIQNREIANAGWETLQLELGDAATEYEPYNPDNTVYGGYVDIAKGEVVATYAYHTLNGIETNWSVDDGSSSSYNRAYINSARWNAAAKPKGKLYCNYCKTDSLGVWYGWVSNANSNILFYIPLELDTVDKWKAYLSEHPLDICYELNEPLHYPLSKTELKTFLDQNNIWFNTNDITEVSYQIHDSNMIHNTKLAMIAHSHDLPPAYQQYDYLRTSGNNARIDTGITGDDTTLQIKCEFKFTQINNSYIGVFGNYKNENDAYCWRAILPNISTYPEPNFLYVTAGNGTPGNGNGLSGTMLIHPCYENNTNPPILDKKIKIDMKYGSCHSTSSTKDFTATATTQTADANTNNICLGAMSTTSAGGTTQCRIYSFKLYSQNHLVRNYVPCIRKSDSKAGFYDLVNHTFNPSIGSVEFVAGNEE